MTDELQASRRRLLTEAPAIAVSAIGFGFVYGLSAREAGFSPIEAMAMSTIVFAGAAQFAAVGYVASGLAWPAILLLTALLNARHLLYSAALRPWLRDVPVRPPRGDGPPPHRRGLRAVDRATSSASAGPTSGATGSPPSRATFIPWNLATLAGVVLGGQIPDPARFGIDIIFPAAMIGIAVGLITGRRELVAALAGAVVGVVVALLSQAVHRDHRGRAGRAASRAARAGRREPRDRAHRDAGLGRALRDAGHPPRRGDRPAAATARRGPRA